MASKKLLLVVIASLAARKKLLLVTLLSLVAISAIAIGTWKWLPDLICPRTCVDVSTLEGGATSEATIVVDKNGGEAGRFFVEHRRPVKLSEVPGNTKNAFLAIEDQRFYRHKGLDLARVLGALAADFRHGKRQGASTITMQLARNLHPDALPPSDRSWRRKIREMATAVRMEREHSKSEILERYLNVIYFGQGAFGIEAAAKVYFHKSTKDLTLAEGALLAALPRSPSSENPYRNAKAAMLRRNLVLREMARAGTISRPQAAETQKSTLGVTSRSDLERDRVAAQGGYFVEEVRIEMSHILGDKLYRGGLRIYTTLDQVVQIESEMALETGLKAIEDGKAGPLAQPGPARLEGAVVILDKETAAVRALVGGRNFGVSRFNRATQSRRQMGSVFKPFIYAAALERGWRATSTISDGAVSITMPDGSEWTPHGAGVGEEDSSGDMVAPVITLRHAISWSRNAASVRLAQRVGFDSVGDLARRAGVMARKERVYPSTMLGSGGVAPIALARSYLAFFRDDGAVVDPHLVDSVKNSRGEIVWQYHNRVTAIITHETAIRMRRLLKSVVDNGTATMAFKNFKGEAAGKTGTSNGGADAWFAGGSGPYVGVVWAGYDTPLPIVRGKTGTGGHLAAPILANILARVLPDSGKGSHLGDDAQVDERATVEEIVEDEVESATTDGRIEIETGDGRILCLTRQADGSSTLGECPPSKENAAGKELPKIQPGREETGTPAAPKDTLPGRG